MAGHYRESILPQAIACTLGGLCLAVVIVFMTLVFDWRLILWTYVGLGALHTPVFVKLLRKKPLFRTAAFVFGFSSVPIATLIMLELYRLVLPVSIVSIWFAIFLARQLIKDLPPPAHCNHCGYNLHKLTESRCPECGTEFDPNLINRQAE